MSATEAKQRLVAIDVGEVSIVDHPANEEPFVVTKAKDAAASATVAAVTKAGVVLDPYTASWATLNAVQSCVYGLADSLRDPSKLGEAQQHIERIKAMLQNAEQFATMVNKASTDITAEVTKAKGEGKKAPPFMKESMQKLMDTLKAAMDDGEPDGDEEAATTKALEIVLKAGKKQFSKERVGKLTEAYKHMATMLKEADPEAFTKAMDEIVPQPKPATGLNGSAASGGGGTTGTNTDEPKPATPANGSVNKSEPVIKSDEPPAWFKQGMDSIQKSITEVKTTTEAVSKRVEAVEKVEAVSKALPQNGSDDVKPVVKADNIWKGVL